MTATSSPPPSTAGVIVTYNLRDFPASALTPYHIEAQHPDAFVCRLLDGDASLVVGAVREQRANLQHPPNSAEMLLDTLGRQGLTQTVARLRPLADQF